MDIKYANILENKQIANDIFSMWIEADLGYFAAGRFINLYLDRGEFLLPRPISICEKIGNKIRLVYHIAGDGTKIISELKAGEKIKVSDFLGNVFNIHEGRVALIGGGIGLPPLLELAKNFKNSEIQVFAGFRNSDLVILEEEFTKLDLKFNVSTDDGSYGFTGNVIESLKASGFNPEHIYACGPNVMLNAVQNYAIENNIPSYLSMEERMGCGYGACVGCAVKVKSDNDEGFTYKKLCKVGPVMDGNKVIF